MTHIREPADPDAVYVLHRHLALVFEHSDSWIDLIDADALFEFPFAAHLNQPVRLEGKKAIRTFIETVMQHFETLAFSDIECDVRANGNATWATFAAAGSVKGTARPYTQEYVAYLELKQGRIIRYREYWDPIRVAIAFGFAPLPSADGVSVSRP